MAVVMMTRMGLQLRPRQNLGPILFVGTKFVERCIFRRHSSVKRCALGKVALEVVGINLDVFDRAFCG